MANEVAKYLAENDVGDVGVDIFVGNMPEKRANCIGIFDSPSERPEQYYTVDKPGIQVLVRRKASQYNDAVELATTIYNLLNRRQNLTMGDADVMFCAAIARPYSLGLDETNRWMITCNYQLRIRQPNA